MAIYTCVLLDVDNTILDFDAAERQALTDMLAEMDKRLKPGGLDFAKTHPPPKDRITELNKQLGSAPAPSLPPAARARFLKATRDL